MYKFIFTIIVSLLFPQQWASDLYEENASSVVVVFNCYEGNCEDRFGSGFIANNQGVIITNRHVLEDADSILVWDLQLESLVKAEIDYIHPKLDFAFLKTDMAINRALKIGDSKKMKIGNEIAAIGTPTGFTNSLTKGIISGFREWESGDWIQIDATIAPGSSGGPLFNKSGEVIGITSLGFGAISKGADINLALAINVVKEKLNKRYPKSYTVSKTTSQLNQLKKRTKKQVPVSNKKQVSVSRAFRGSDIFNNYCTSCHVMKGSANTLMNLGDNEWKNGDSYDDIYNIIANGKSGTTKFPWKGILSRDDIASVTRYIMYYGESDNE